MERSVKSIDQKPQVVMTAVLINTVLTVKHCYDFGKIKNGLMTQTLMVGFSGILDTDQVKDRKMMKDKLIVGIEL